MIARGWRSAVLFLLLGLAFPARALCGQELLIGLIPEENVFNQMNRYRPLAAFLSDRLGVKVKLTILSRYGDVIDKFTARKMDGAFFGVFTCALAMEKLGVQPVARPVSLDGSSTVQSYIFVRRDSGIRNISDMKGKRMAFVDPATVTGYLYALAFLREKGVGDLSRFFKEYYFTGSHDSTILSVLDGRADVGVAKSRLFQKMIEKDPVIRDELVVIAKSADFPDITLCLRKDLDPGLRARITDILLGMDGDPAGREVLKKFAALRFDKADRSDFSFFDGLAGKARISIKGYRYK